MLLIQTTLYVLDKLDFLSLLPFEPNPNHEHLIKSWLSTISTWYIHFPPTQQIKWTKFGCRIRGCSVGD